MKTIAGGPSPYASTRSAPIVETCVGVGRSVPMGDSALTAEEHPMTRPNATTAEQVRRTMSSCRFSKQV
jgi:hypothetical protein